eukprot:XP_025983436.1 uncharacterized protein LOC106794315 isoform X2 [Glycine max]
MSSCYVYLLYLSEVCPCYVCLLYYQLDHANELSNSLKESANINTVWASLIVEECTRLGLMSPKKVNLVAALVRGMLVKDALMQLELTIKRAAKTVYQGILISNCPRLCSEILDKLNHPFLPALSICFLPDQNSRLFDY